MVEQNWCLSFLLLVSVGMVWGQAGTNSCKWRKNITDIQEVSHHKYVILEECLYYFLSQKADKDYEKGNALVVLPPTKGKDALTVTLHKALVRQMWMNEVWREMHINGYMLLSWSDPRLKWNSYDWHLEKLKIKTYGHLWMPDIYSERYQTSVQANDFTLYQDIEATRDGNVSARLEYRMQAQCEIDFSNYPGDKKICCFNLQSYMFGDLIKFQVLDQQGHLDLDRIQTNWDVEDVTIGKRQDREDKREFIKFCLTAGRKNSTLRIELTLPMVISAILVLIAPLFGHFKHQLFVKLFSLLLQFLCFQFLVTKTPQIGFGATVPRIYKFYEFTLSMTLVSLLLTLITSAVGRMERSLPPPHGALLAASAINAKLCCAEVEGGEGKEVEGGGGAVGASGYVREWRQIFGAINNLLSLIIIITYVLGVIVICS